MKHVLENASICIVSNNKVRYKILINSVRYVISTKNVKEYFCPEKVQS